MENKNDFNAPYKVEPASERPAETAQSEEVKSKPAEATAVPAASKKNNTPLKVAVGIALAAAIGVGGFFGYKALHKPPVEDSASSGIVWDANSEEGGLVQKSKEEIQAELNKKVEEGMINISMNTSPVFENGKAKGNLLIVNSEKNNYPQIVYIVRKDNQEEIYRSGGIAVGSKVETAALAVDLPAGTYPCTAYFNNVDPETGEFLGTAGAEIEITVQN